MKTLKRILGVLLIFFFGVFIGAAVTSAGAVQKFRETLLGGPDAVMDVIVKRLDHELKLDDEQKRKLQTIMDDAHIRLRQSRAKIQPEVESTLHDAEERTRAILYPHQVPKFDEFVKRGREKWKAASDGAPAPGATPAPAAEQEHPSPSPTPPSDTKTGN
jgi:hypothetical protein